MENEATGHRQGEWTAGKARFDRRSTNHLCKFVRGFIEDSDCDDIARIGGGDDFARQHGEFPAIAGAMMDCGDEL